MSETIINCIECGVTYTMPDSEKKYFEDLIARFPSFRMPRRCAECRKKRRTQASSQPQTHLPGQGLSTWAPQGSGGITAGPIQGYQGPHEPVQAPMPYGAPPETKRIEIERIVLVGAEFSDLVCGRPVIRNGVHVVLADIGVDAMRKAIDRAVIEKALKGIV